VLAVQEAIADKIKRIRGAPGPLSPHAAAPQDMVRPTVHDPWTRRLGFGALGFLVLALVLFVVFKLGLLSGASGLHSTASILAH